MNYISALVLLAAPNKPNIWNSLLDLRKATSLTPTYTTDPGGGGGLRYEKVGDTNRLEQGLNQGFWVPFLYSTW